MTPEASGSLPALGTASQSRPQLKRVSLALFCVLMFAYSVVHQGHLGGTPKSRLNLLHSLLLHGTFRIDAYHENTPDKAVFEGHYYSDKAPGGAALALPGFAISAGVMKLLNIDLDSTAGWRYSSWLTIVLGVGIFTAAGGVACFLWLLHWLPPKPAMLTTLALFLGAAPFPYATMFFTHAQVAGMIALALLCLAPAPRIVPWSDATRFSLAGFACGWALVSELQAGLVVVALGLVVLLNGVRATVRFSLAALPPLLLIPAYSWVCFGTPFTLGYSHQASFPEMQKGLFGIVWPDALTALNLLFSPTRGLFFWSPFFLLALYGYRELWASSRRWFWLCLILPALQVLVISGYTWDWTAGYVLLPRYLTPVLPLLALPAGFAAKRWPAFSVALAIVSIVLITVATFVSATPPDWIYNPLTEWVWPFLLQGSYTNNLAMFFYVYGHWGAWPLMLLIWSGAFLLWRAAGQLEVNRRNTDGETSAH